MSPSSHSRLLVPILCLLTAFGIFSTALYLPSLPAIGKALGASQKSVQLTLTFFFLGSTVGSLLLGPLADRLGRLVVIKGGLLLFIVASLGCAQAESIFVLHIGRFLQGIAASAGPLVARAVSRDLYEGVQLARLSATMMMAASITPAIAPTLGGIIQSHFGWEENFYFLMIVGVFTACMVWPWLPETKGYHKEASVSSSALKNYLLLFKGSPYGLFCIVMGVQLAAVFCYVSMSPYLFISLYGWPPEQFGYAGAVSAFGNMIGFAFARRMAHRLHFHHGILIGGTLSFLVSLIFVGACLLFPIGSFWLLFYIICFYSVAAMAIVNSTAAAMNLFPQMAGTSSAMVGAIQIGSGVIGSALASFLPSTPLFLGIAIGGLTLVSCVTGIFIERKRWLGR